MSVAAFELSDAALLPGHQPARVVQLPLYRGHRRCLQALLCYGIPLSICRLIALTLQGCSPLLSLFRPAGSTLKLASVYSSLSDPEAQTC